MTVMDRYKFMGLTLLTFSWLTYMTCLAMRDPIEMPEIKASINIAQAVEQGRLEQVVDEHDGEFAEISVVPYMIDFSKIKKLSYHGISDNYREKEIRRFDGVFEITFRGCDEDVLKARSYCIDGSLFRIRAARPLDVDKEKYVAELLQKRRWDGNKNAITLKGEFDDEVFKFYSVVIDGKEHGLLKE